MFISNTVQCFKKYARQAKCESGALFWMSCTTMYNNKTKIAKLEILYCQSNWIIALTEKEIVEQRALSSFYSWKNNMLKKLTNPPNQQKKRGIKHQFLEFHIQSVRSFPGTCIHFDPIAGSVGHLQKIFVSFYDCTPNFCFIPKNKIFVIHIMYHRIISS